MLTNEYVSRDELLKKRMTKWIIFIVVLFVYMLSMTIYGNIKSHYEWDLLAGSQWQLADRSSTLEAKSQYINSFLAALENMKEKGMLSEHNAFLLKTPQNKTENNILVLKTLQKRLEEVSGMDTKSFEYNQAIQQITAQEQGEAHALISDIFGSFQMGRYWYVWGWVNGVIIFAEVILGFGIFFLLCLRFSL